jgi:hypothetical protein
LPLLNLAFVPTAQAAQAPSVDSHSSTGFPAYAAVKRRYLLNAQPRREDEMFAGSIILIKLLWPML